MIAGPHLTRGRTLALLATILVAAYTTTGNLNVDPAYAGSWIEVSCQTPSGAAAPSQGWTSFTTGSIGSGSNNDTNCGPMSAELSSAASDPVGASENLQYTPPAGSTLAGGTLDVYLNGTGYGTGASGTAIVYSPEYAYNGSNVVLQCSSGQPPCSPSGYIYSGTLSLPANHGGNVYVGAGCGGESVQSCNEGASEGAWSLVRVYWAQLLLTNNSTPAANNISGTLLTPNARGTRELTLAATDPSGPGVYTLTAQIDGHTIYNGTPNTNSGHCSQVGTSGSVLMFAYNQPCPTSESVDLPIDTTTVSDGSHTLKLTVTDAAGNSSVVYDGTITTFNAPVNSSTPSVEASDPQITVGDQLTGTNGSWEAPSGAGTIAYTGQWLHCNTEGNDCQPEVASGSTYTVHTSDVNSTLRYKVTAKNNDGSATALSEPTALVPEPKQDSAPPGPGGPTSTTSNNNTTSSSSSSSTTSSTSITSNTTTLQKLGAPNGTNASQAAYIHLGLNSTINSPYTKRRLTIRGRLLDPTGQPIGNATLETLQKISTPNAPMNKTGIIHTAADGSFTAHIPAGPTRLIRLAYRAFANDVNYSYTRDITQNVSAGITLHVAPHRITPHENVTLTGRLLGGYIGNGQIVELEVHYLGAWQVFNTPRTKPNGTFKVNYRFKGSTGVFPFRARIRTTEGYPYTLGYSPTHDVHST